MLAMLTATPLWDDDLLVGFMVVVVSIGFLFYNRFCGKMERGFYPSGPRDKSLWRRWCEGDPLRRKKWLAEYDGKN